MKPRGEPGTLGRSALILLAVTALLLAYYWAHKPLDLALAYSFGGAILDLGTAAGLFAVAGGIGRRALARLDWAGLSLPERLALETLAGLGLVSTAALLLGLTGLFRGAVLWPALLLAALVLRRDVRALLADARLLAGRLDPGTRWGRLLALVAASLLALALVRALAPPSAWDALTYHLVGPARYLADGRIAPAADNVFLGFPQAVEMLYGVAFALFGRDTAAAPVHFGLGVLGLLAVAGLVRRHADRQSGWLAAVLLLSAPSLWLLFGQPYVDLAVLAAGAAAFAAVLRWSAAGGAGWLLLAGAFGGGAFGVKYTAGSVLLALAVYVLARERRRALPALIRLGGAALIAALPWLVKGTLLYGNPVYPFLFGGLAWDPLRTATFSTSGQGFLATGDLLALVTLPLAATVLGVERGPGFAFSAGPWLLTLPFLLLLAWRACPPRARGLATSLALLGGPLLLIWALLAALTGIGAQTRLAMPLLAVAAALAALAVHALDGRPEKPVHVAFLVRALVTLTLALGIVESARHTLGEGGPDTLLGGLPRESYLDRTVQAHAGAMRALSALPEGSRVRFLWEPRAYYCPRHVVCRPDILLDAWGHPLRLGQAPEAVLDSWRQQGDGYLLVWDAGYAESLTDPRFGAENALFARVVDGWAPLWTDGLRYRLYALASP